jgi:hypothetical protein
MWKTMKRALGRRRAGWKMVRGALGKWSTRVRNVLAFLALLAAYAVRARSERRRWDDRLRRQADAGHA